MMNHGRGRQTVFHNNEYYEAFLLHFEEAQGYPKWFNFDLYHALIQSSHATTFFVLFYFLIITDIK